ncbi:Sodium:dicarboxylate symporter [Alteracholeplasma palmae J233]|uniref:L-cystine uptake protein TcyP n=1 Tax=Alteracholeplasma palmae (strain ATCC 49389 / J233) TaxID=1318466 RepID=U4KKB5_ALTPJ|nr:dicarboxylate/amino acid:cation symporter [Alteracholeplasma palmae]CCV64012.1 Sodium:dicarboxylate symporter [Alteracholeplasma palmae J233]
MFKNYEIDSWQKGVLYLVAILVVGLLMFMSKKKVKFSYKVLTGMLLGLIVGLIFGQTKTQFNGAETTITATIRPIGQLYLRLIQMVVMPLVLTAVIKSFTSLEDTNKLKRIGGKTLFWLLGTTAAATLIGYGFASIFNLGKGFAVDPDATGKTITTIENVILGFFPNNIVTAMSGNVAIPVVVFGIFVSVAIIVESKRKPERMKPFLEFNESFNRIMVRVTKFVIQLTPYAVFAFMSYAVGRNNIDALKNLALYIGLIYGAMAFHFVFVQMGILAAHKISPIQFIKKFSQAMVVAFTTQSSYGTLPVTQRTLKEKIGASEPIVDFVAPIGANVGMNACGGIFPAMVAVITANAYGIEFGFVQVLVLVLTTTIASIGIAGVPGIATIAATVTLSALGLPLEGIALVVSVDALVDMGRTMINVVGTGVAATVVAKSEKELDMEVFNAPLEKNN